MMKICRKQKFDLTFITANQSLRIARRSFNFFLFNFPALNWDQEKGI